MIILFLVKVSTKMSHKLTRYLNFEDQLLLLRETYRTPPKDGHRDGEICDCSSTKIPGIYPSDRQMTSVLAIYDYTVVLTDRQA